MSDETITNGLESENEDLIAGRGINLLQLLGGFDGVILTLFVTLYRQNRDGIGNAADRLFTISDANFQRFCRTLGIPEANRPELRAAFTAFADHAGDLLVAIADAKVE